MENPSWNFAETAILYKKKSAKTNIAKCSFNINGTKDKDVSLDQKLENFDLLVLQEHLPPLVSLNSLRRSNEHLAFFQKYCKTSGRPSGGLACLIKKTLFSPPPPLCYFESDCYIAIQLAILVLINVCLSCDQKSPRRFKKIYKILHINKKSSEWNWE